MNSLWIYYLFFALTMISLPISENNEISLYNQWIYHEFTISIVKSQWFTIKSRVYYEFNIFLADKLSIYNLFANSSWINFEFSAWTMNSLSILRIHYEFTVFIKNLVRIHLIFREFIMNSYSLSRIRQEYTWSFTNLLWIHYLFHDFTIKSLSNSKFIMNLVSALPIHSILR